EFKKADLDFKHGVRISTDFAPEASILGNPKDLVTIIDCLLDNAQEAMTSQEEKCITLKTAAGQHTVKLTIEDNGSGLPFCSPCRHNSECLSCPEFHIGRTTKEKGSGLGITLVRNSIAKLNGDLRIESGPGRGTAVQIWFPRNRKHAKAAG
ncbi:MAG: ATP-binding protein, partial [Spirochaetales bacterium]